MDKGDLVVTVSGRTGVAAILNIDACIHDGIVGLKKLSKDASTEYLYYFFKFNSLEIASKSVGAIFKNLTTDQIKNLEIPLPDLATQKHIAAVLDKADALRQQNRQLLAHYDELLQSTFIELFGDPVKNPKGWVVKEVNEVVKKIESGWSPVCLETSRESEDEWAVLKLGAITYRVFNPKDNKRLPPHLEGRETIEVKKDDLLFSRKNTRHLVGATVFVSETPPKLILPDTVFRLKYTDKVNARYLLYLFNEKDFRVAIQNLASGSSGSMPNISKEKLLKLEIPLPPLPLQQHFAKIVEQIEVQKEAVRQSLAESEALFEGLLAGYFGAS